MKYLITLILFCMLLGCEKNNEIYSCKGIPDENQAFSFMYFKTESEGYLFGTLTHYQEMSDKDLDDPNFSPQSTEEANIYKTLDGGNSWKKIDTILNRKYFDRALPVKDFIYIGSNDFYSDKVYLVKFNIIKDKIEFENNYEVLGGIVNCGKDIFIQTNKESVSKFDDNFIIKDKSNINIGTQNLCFRNIIYTVFRDKNGKNTFSKINKINSNIELTIYPECLSNMDENNILIAGNNKKDDNEIDLVSYNIDTKKPTVIKEFKGYSIVQGLQSNDKVIAGFIGNISGAFTKYDLFYSLDQGKTWHIKKLEEASYIRPSYLVSNVMYIYSGGARMQKIILER